MAKKEVQRTVFNEAQLYLLKVFSTVKDESELRDIKRLISNYYYKKAEKAMKKLDAEKAAKKQKSRKVLA